jgi:hypothetical protein
MSLLQELLEAQRKSGVGYLSDTSINWFNSYIKSNYNSNQKKILLDEIKNYEKQDVLLMGRFYTFDYIPIRPKNKNIPVDRKPFILLLDQKDGYVHGINLNYFPLRNMKRNFMNKIFSYLTGNYLSDTSKANRLALNYDMMKLKSTFFEPKVTYSTYIITRMINVKIIPIKLAKIFCVLDNSKFLYPKEDIYKISRKKAAKAKRKMFYGNKKKIG